MDFLNTPQQKKALAELDKIMQGVQDPQKKDAYNRLKAWANEKSKKRKESTHFVADKAYKITPPKK